MKIGIWGNNRGDITSFKKCISFFNAHKVDGYIGLGNYISRGSGANLNWMKEFIDPTKSLRTPLNFYNWAPCLGENDVGTDNFRRSLFRSYLKDYYVCYQFMGTDITVLSLDTTKNLKKQYQWLKDEMQSGEWRKSPFRIVLMSRPLYYSSKFKWGHRWWRRITKLLTEDDFPTHVILSSHHSVYFKDGIANIPLMSTSVALPWDYKSVVPYQMLNFRHDDQKAKIESSYGIINVYQDRLEFTFYNIPDHQILTSFNIWRMKDV